MLSDSGESLPCFLAGVNKSYVIATTDLWLFIYASNLLPPLSTPFPYISKRTDYFETYYYPPVLHPSVCYRSAAAALPYTSGWSHSEGWPPLPVQGLHGCAGNQGSILPGCWPQHVVPLAVALATMLTCGCLLQEEEGVSEVACRPWKHTFWTWSSTYRK